MYCKKRNPTALKTLTCNEKERNLLLLFGKLATEFKRFYIKGDHRDEDIKSRQSIEKSILL